MKFLATSPSGLWRIDGGEFECLISTSYNACFWGITWDKEFVYAVRREHDDVDMLYQWNKKLFPEHPVKHALKDVKETHQIFWWNDKIYMANTRFNRITIIEQDKKGRWGQKDFSWSFATRDENHINSIWANNDHIYFVENRGSQALSGRSLVRIYDAGLNYYQRVQVGRDVHNIFYDHDCLIMCSSADASLLAFDHRHHEVSLEARFIGNDYLRLNNCFPRGLAADEDHYYTGFSRSYRKGEQRTTDGGYVVINEDFRIVDVVKDSAIDCIHDLRLIDPIDRAHNGVPYGG